MKYFNSALYITIGVIGALTYKKYEDEITYMCKKMKKKEKELIKMV